MFEGDTNVGLLNVARGNQHVANQNARQANWNARQADINLQSALEWKEYAHGLEQRVAELEADLASSNAVQRASDVALDQVTREWRASHPISPMHDVLGKLRDGRDVKRNLAVWMVAFDNEAPEAGHNEPRGPSNILRASGNINGCNERGREAPF